jgi:hypothetical protein
LASLVIFSFVFASRPLSPCRNVPSRTCSEECKRKGILPPLGLPNGSSPRPLCTKSLPVSSVKHYAISASVPKPSYVLGFLCGSPVMVAEIGFAIKAWPQKRRVIVRLYEQHAAKAKRSIRILCMRTVLSRVLLNAAPQFCLRSI